MTHSSLDSQMPRLAIGDCQLYYERHGDGFPVLFIAGLNGHGAFWRGQIPAFARRFEAIVYDQRGVGRSDHSRTCYTIDAMAADALALMDGLGLDKVHIVGHAVGGAVAQTLALEHPGRLASIVVASSWTRADAYLRRLFALRRDVLMRLGPAAYLQTATLLRYPAWWITKRNEELRQLEAQLLATFSPPEIVASRIDAILAFDRTAELRRIRTPTLIVGCQDDLVAPCYFAEELGRLIPGAEIKMFPRGGHCFTEVMAREFNNAVLPFLAAHTGELPEPGRSAGAGRAQAGERNLDLRR